MNDIIRWLQVSLLEAFCCTYAIVPRNFLQNSPAFFSPTTARNAQKVQINAEYAFDIHAELKSSALYMALNRFTCKAKKYLSTIRDSGVQLVEGVNGWPHMPLYKICYHVQLDFWKESITIVLPPPHPRYKESFKVWRTVGRRTRNTILWDSKNKAVVICNSDIVILMGVPGRQGDRRGTNRELNASPPHTVGMASIYRISTNCGHFFSKYWKVLSAKLPCEDSLLGLFCFFFF